MRKPNEHSRVLDTIANQPWAMTEEGLRQIIAIAERQGDIEAVRAREGDWMGPGMTMRGDIALLTMRGPLVRYATLFSDISGATSIQTLAKNFAAAIDDPNVAGVIIEADSPGGAVAGTHEFAEMIFGARGSKPIVTYVGWQLASAAYWIGTAADEVVIDRTSMVGSIGVLYTVTDTSASDARRGIRTLEFVSSQSPHKRIDLDADEGRAKIQKIVDDVADVFVESVAKYRNVAVETVLSEFGQGNVLVGAEAIDAGMADRLGSLEQVIAGMQKATASGTNRFGTRRSYSMATVGNGGRQAASSSKGKITVKNTAELHAALVGGYEPGDISIEEIDVEAIRKEGHAAGAAEEKTKADARVTLATQKAIDDERARITGLQEISVKGFETEIAAAIKSGASVEATATDLLKKQRERGTSMASLRQDAPGALGAGGKGPAAGDPDAGKGDTGWSARTKRWNEKRKTGTSKR